MNNDGDFSRSITYICTLDIIEIGLLFGWWNIGIGLYNMKNPWGKHSVVIQPAGVARIRHCPLTHNQQKDLKI